MQTAARKPSTVMRPVAGPPMVPTLYNNVKRIVQTDSHVVILAEMVHDARIAALCSQNGIAELLTADRDFGRFHELKDGLAFEEDHGGIKGKNRRQSHEKRGGQARI